MLPRVDESAHT